MKKKTDRYNIVHSSIRELVESFDILLRETRNNIPLEDYLEVLTTIKAELVDIGELLRRKNTKYRNTNGRKRASN